MKIKEGYIKVESFGGFVVTPVGEESKNNKIMLTLNGTASEIWDMLGEGKMPMKLPRRCPKNTASQKKKHKTVWIK